MLVGRGRVADVEALENAFARVAEGEGSRLVVLEAPTGWGKTRLVQEFYDRLAAGQTEPKYWPAQFVEGDTDRWVTTRKRVHPAKVDVAAGAVMLWMWWGVSCSLRQDGRPAQALFDDATQLAAHAGSIYDRMSTKDAASVGFDGTNALVGVLGGLGMAAAAPVGVSLLVGGTIKSLWDHRDVVARLRQWAERRRTPGGRTLDADEHGRGSQIAELADSAAKVSRDVPIIMVIDDAHWADPTLIEFVDTVMRAPKGAFLIVATSWPRGSAGGDPFHAWLESAPSGAVDRRVLSEFGRAELAALVRQEYALIVADEQGWRFVPQEDD